MSKSNNIYWREALASSEGVQRSPCDKFFLSGGAVVFWNGEESYQAEGALYKASRPKKLKAVRTNKPDLVMEPVWISNDPTGHCYARAVFGMMVQLADMQNYHSDLFHDALSLDSVSDEFQIGSEVLWMAHHSGTHISIDPDWNGFPSDYVPEWYPGDTGDDGRFAGKTYRFKVELIMYIPHWTVTRFRSEVSDG